MSLYQTLNMAHGGAAIFLFLLALGSISISVLIAVRPAKDAGNQALVTRANTVGRIQTLVVGIVALTGIIAAFMGSWPLSEFWLWSSLVVVVFYVFALEYVTKPARLAVAEGGSEGKVGLQVGLQVAHVLLLLVVFASMMVKPA